MPAARPATKRTFYAELEALAMEAALGAAHLIAQRLVPTSVQTKSSSTDLVTDVDRAVEAAVIDLLRSRRPADAVLGEEGGARPSAAAPDEPRGHDDVRWVIDPIDGTVNFVLGLPIFAVSIAAEVAGTVVAGCVVDAARAGTGDVFHAHLGGGSFVGLGDAARRLRGPRAIPLAEAVVGTGFSYDGQVRTRQAGVLTAVLGCIANLRRLGSAALDLCYVADGRLDAYYEAGTKQWDRAAGMLVASEAGVRVGAVTTVFPGQAAHSPGSGSWSQNPLAGVDACAALDQCLLAAGPDLFVELGTLLAGAGAADVLDR